MAFLKKLDWINTPFLIFAHLMAGVGAAYLIGVRFSWWTLGLGALWIALAGVSITGGYHRLFAHTTYKCHPALRLFYLFFGAAGLQNSALKWSSDHRRHHNYVDEEQDPYNIRKGFWWAHMGWIFMKEGPPDTSNVPDLAADPLIRFQHRFYVPLAILAGWLLPSALALSWGDPIGGFLVAGFVRLVIQYQTTFSINSVAHTIGSQPYSDADSSRDSFWTALVSMGEGYHNYHHRFSLDYRNGVRPWQFDPTKWWVKGLSWLRITWDLRRAPQEMILKARLKMDQKRLEALLRSFQERPTWASRLQTARESLEALADKWGTLRGRYESAKAEMSSRTREEIRRLKSEMRAARAELMAAYRMWRLWLRRPELLATA